MTALKQAIEHFKNINSQPVYSNNQIVYILEQFLKKENKFNNNSEVFFNSIDKHLMISELYYNEQLKNK
jgi:hypothetical protein